MKGPRLTTEGVEILEKAADFMEEEPRRVHMHTWLKRFTKRQIKKDDDLPPCGTVACVAGTIVLVAGNKTQKKTHGDNVGEVAAGILGLPYSEWQQGLDEHGFPGGYADSDLRNLFLPSYWPQKWRVKLWKERQGEPEYAAVVADYTRQWAKKFRPRKERKRK